MAKRDPHDVLGVTRGSAPSLIKAAWRRLARTNHPDLTGDDPAASSAATRRMAEINDAYAALTREAERDRREAAGERAEFGEEPIRRGGPPRPRTGRPVTGRVDMSDTYQPRNQTTAREARNGSPAPSAASGAPTGATTLDSAADLRGQPPMRGERVRSEAPRASAPTGPMVRDQVAHFRRPAPPSLDAARGHVIEFGKFHGHSLGDIAAFEPSYIDWVVSTVTRDPELVSAARVIQTEMDERGIARRAHALPDRSGSTI